MDVPVSSHTAVTSQHRPRKRIRRTADEIDRNYKCEMAGCEKAYGSEIALQKHCKLKHPEHPYAYRSITRFEKKYKIIFLLFLD